MMKITPLGAVVWTSLIMPSAAGSATICNEISDVHERWNPYNSNYEYYGVAGHGAYPTAGVGNNLVVYKLDDNGSNTLSPDEFHYSQGHGPSNPFSLAELTLIGNGTGSNDGIQVFGTYGSTASQHHFVKAYFNGVSDCYESHTNIDSIKAGPSSLSTHNISVSQVATNCQLLFEIIYTSNTTGVTTLCSASSVSSGNNNKHAFISGINENEISKISISPNPVNSHLKIKVDGLDNNILSIQIQDVAGRLYNTNFAKISNEEYKVELNELSLTPGYYLLFVKGKDTFYAKPFIIDLK
jgi:hypothetical protein